MSRPSDIVAIALAEVGYREKASNASLDDKSANAGSANWTKYARDLAAAGYYNGNKNGYAWCDVFVDWCFFKAYGAVEGQRIQCQSGPLGAGCIYSAQYYQQKGRYDKTPKVGDQVFFQTGRQIGHTGIVVEVTGSTIVTVEGNSSDQVKRNTYSRSNSYIAGYGHPLYSDSDADEPTKPAAEAGASTVTCIVSIPQLKNGATGAAVKNAQTLLIAKGYPCGGKVTAGRETADGDFGPTTEKSVKSFQAQKNLTADGIIGAATWKALLTS
ncbi:MAG: peptidoglycan-binding protein [Oscillospiraceae bacterium]|nr:peptidoglycan-binding protein [Oscillospiraceae bacterium]